MVDGTATHDEFRQRMRAAWTAGDPANFARLIEPVGPVVLERIDCRPGVDLLDVGTGTGGSVAIPAARRGANVVGLDLAPALFEQAGRRAAEAGVDVEWVEGDAQDLPFPDESFDRVVSTFGAMFAPDHGRAAREPSPHAPCSSRKAAGPSSARRLRSSSGALTSPRTEPPGSRPSTS